MKKVTQLPELTRLILKGMALLVTFCFFAGSSYGQGTVLCPPNIDFENGDFSKWICWTGLSSTGGNATTPVQFTSGAISGPVATRHTITSGTGVDAYGGFPVVPAGGGNYAARIGNNNYGGEAERIQYYVHVPIGFQDYSFNFRFACVLEDIGHPLNTQPQFTIAAFDSATGAALPCAQQNYVASSALIPLGFKNFPISAYDTARYLPWTGSALPLINQGGKTIIIEVTSYDCSAGGHFGYGYFDVISCGKYKAAVSYCNLDSGIVRFIGTGITQAYNWYTSKGTLIGTGPYVDVTIPNTPDYFYGLPVGGAAGCFDTVFTDTVSNFQLVATPKTPCIQFGNTIQLNASVVGGKGPFNYQWSGFQSATLSCTNCQNPVAAPFDTTIYFVSATDRIGCTRKDTVEVYQAPNAGPDLKVCPLGEKPAQLHVAGPPNAQFHWYEFGTNSPGKYLDCTDCTDPLSAPVPDTYTYTVGYDGCPVLDTIVVSHDNSNYIVTPQDAIIQCRPGYRDLLSEAKGPNPKANIACGNNNPITCLPADELTATIGIPGTPPKAPKNTPFYTANGFMKYQFIVKKKDILYNGLYSGTLNSIAFKTLGSAIISTVPVDNITISLGCIAEQDFKTPTDNNSFFSAVVLTDVASVPSLTLTPNAWNVIPFNISPYSWDTTKNLLVSICVGPILNPDVNGLDPVSMEEGVAIQKVSNSINVCGGNAPSVSKYAQRPTVQFNYCQTPDLPFDYTWRPGNNLQDSTLQNVHAYIARSIDYSVYSVGRNGCLLKAPLHITVPDHHLNAGPIDTFVCQGQPAFLFATGAANGYKWYEYNEGLFSDASGSLSCIDCQYPTATPSKTTTYAIVYANEVGAGNSANPEYATGCPDTAFITVHVWNLPNVEVLNSDTTILIGQSVPLYVQGAQHYTWSPAAHLSDPNAPMTMASPTTTTTYIATGFDFNGCPYRDTVKISVRYHDNVLIPSGFTPNGDGLNDIFRIVNPNVQRLMEFRVFNRWGQEVFTTTDINSGWDGTWKGVKQDVGTYQYIIRVGYGDSKTELFKGDVQLIR